MTYTPARPGRPLEPATAVCAAMYSAMKLLPTRPIISGGVSVCEMVCAGIMMKPKAKLMKAKTDLIP